jgi:hypothetical protein
VRVYVLLDEKATAHQKGMNGNEEKIDQTPNTYPGQGRVLTATVSVKLTGPTCIQAYVRTSLIQNARKGAPETPCTSRRLTTGVNMVVLLCLQIQVALHRQRIDTLPVIVYLKHCFFTVLCCRLYCLYSGGTIIGKLLESV